MFILNELLYMKYFLTADTYFGYENIIIYSIVIILVLYLVWWRFFKRTRCPKCKKYFARKITLKTYDGPVSHEVSIIEGSELKDFIYHCVCKHCNHQWVQKGIF